MSLLLRGPHLDMLAELAAQEPPSPLYVLDERMCLVLRHHGNPADPGVDAVGQREVDEPEVAPERHRGFALILGKVLEPRATSARQDHRQGALEHPIEISHMVIALPHFFRDPFHARAP